MRVEQLERERSNQWKALLSDYLNGKDELKTCYHRAPEISSFKDQIEEKKNFKNREVLVTHLLDQYSKLGLESTGHKSLITQLEDENTFTVTTGHQLCIFGGPAYFVYKIAGAIALARRLKKEYPEFNFIPIYWLASEDHDFEEISHFRLFGKKLQWKRNASGPVGRLSNEGLDELGNELKGIFGNSDFAEELNQIFVHAYLKTENLAQATMRFVHAIFEDESLLCLDADSPSLKACFSSVISDELRNESAASSAKSANDQLEKAGYGQQIHIRDINLFYILDGYRERIKREGDRWKTVDDKYDWDWNELEKLLKDHPERFSPNVALRPLYQEMILPNLAYVGGGGEISYWLQLKPIFDHHQTSFPILFPRLSVTAIVPSVQKKIDKLGLDVSAYFQREEDLVKFFLSSQTEIADFAEERQMLKDLENTALSKMQDLEEGFRKSISAEFNGMSSTLGKIYGKYKKQVKQREEISINQLKSVQDALYPEQKLQERIENFSLWYLRAGKEGLAEITSAMDPFAFNMLLFYA